MSDTTPLWAPYFTETAMGGLTVPQYVSWNFPIDKTDILAPIRSKNKRKLLRKSDELLSANNITVETKPIHTEQDCDSLLEFFYSSHREKGHEIAPPQITWFQRRTQQHRNMEALVLSIDEVVIAMKMYSYNESGFYLSHKASLRKWDEEIGIGTILDVLSFTRAAELGYSMVMTGDSRNFYGVEGGLSISLIKYKASMGLLPVAADKKTQWNLVVKSNPAPLSTPFLFFAKKGEIFQAFYIIPDGYTVAEHEIESICPAGMTIVSTTLESLASEIGKTV